MAYSKGTYNIDVTITQGCTIEFQIPPAASSWVHVNPQSGGSGRYVLTIDDGNHGDTTVEVYVNGNHCSSRDIAVTSPPVVTCGCGDLTIPETSYTWSATDDSSKKHSFTISSASCITNITKSSLTHFDAVFESGKVTVNPRGTNTGQQPYTDILTISYKADSNTCSSAITLTQNAATCQASTCYTVNGDAVNTSTVAYDAQNATVEWDYVETVITPPDCVPVTTTKHASTSVTLIEVATCDDVEETGQFTWVGHKACNGGTSDMTVNWKVTKQQPAGCGCSCSANLHVYNGGNLTYEEVTSATEIGTYRIDQDCTDTITVTSVTSSESWLRIDSFTGGSIKAKWDANLSTTNTRSTTIKVFADIDGEPCASPKEITITQDKDTSCKCADISLVPNTEIPATRSSRVVLAEYVTSQAGCSVKDVYVSYVSLNPSGNWVKDVGVDASNNAITATVESNDTASVREITLAITAKTSDNKECTDIATVTAKQKGSACQCDDLIVVTSNGEPVDWGKDIILTSVDEEYTFTYIFNQGKEACFEGTEVTFSYDSTDAEYFIISTGTTGGKSYIKIKPNPDAEPNQIDIYFDYTLSDGTDCSTQWGENFITVIYNPACNCDALLPQDACIQRYVPLAAGTYPLGSFGVMGCGDFTGSSTSDQVEQVIVTPGDDDYQVSVKLRQYTPTQDKPEAASGIEIYLYETGSQDPKCSTTYQILQTASYVDRTRVNKMMDFNGKDNISYYGYDSTTIASISDSAAIETFKRIWGNNNEFGIVSFSSNQSWVGEPFTVDIRNNAIYLDAKTEKNTTADVREATIRIRLNSDKMRNMYGICAYEIINDFTVKQVGNPAYACDCPDPYTTWEISYTGNTSTTYTWRINEVCLTDAAKADNRKIYVPQIAGKDPNDFYDDYVAVNEWLEIKLKADSMSSDPTDHDLRIYWRVGANPRNEQRSYPITFKFGLKDDTTCESTLTILQQAKQNASCEDLKATIHTYKGGEDDSHKLDYSGGTLTFASFDDDLLPTARLSGLVESDCETYIGGVLDNTCSCDSWIEGFEPDRLAGFLNVKVKSNISSANDGSTKPRTASKVKLFLIDENDQPLEIDGAVCEGITISLTQEGYSGACRACSELTSAALPAPNFNGYSTTSYTDASGTYEAFEVTTAGSSEIPLFEFNMTSEVLLLPDALRCFDLLAETEHTANFTQLSDGKYLHVTTDDTTKKWVISGKLKYDDNSTEVAQTVVIQLFLKRRSFIDGEEPTCDSVPFVAVFKVLKKTN